MATPAPRTSLIGRRRELAALRRHLRSTRLLTLVGPGGCGKTRLAMELTRASQRQPAIWVDLAPIRDATQIRPLVEQAVGNVGDERVLIVLDNCEHVAAAAADVAARALTQWQSATVLATSRQPLHMDGELLWRVPGLALPSDKDAKDPARGIRSDAVRLFVERARFVQQDFAFDASSAAHVVAICRRLDGMPLALELAAARLRHFSISTIEDLLGRSLVLLAGQEGGPDPRHRTIRATIDWSYELLTDQERALLRRFAVFAGSFTLEAAAAVSFGSTNETADVVTELSALVDKSLVEFDRSTLRYRLLEPIREYADERLHAAGEDDVTLDRLVAHLNVLFDRELPLGRPPRDTSSEPLVRSEFFNLANVIPWLVRSDPRSAVSLLLRFARWPWAMVPIHAAVVDEWLEQALAVYVKRDGMRAHALAARARILCDLGHLQTAVVAASEARRIADEVASPALTATAEVVGAYISIAQGEPDQGRVQLDDAIPVLEQHDPLMATRALNLRAILRAKLGDHAGAEDDVRSSLKAWERLGQAAPAMRYQTYTIAADVAYRRDDFDGAAKHLRNAIESQRTLENQWAGTFELLAHLLATRGQSDDALRLAGFADRQLGERGLWPDTNFALADRGWLRELEHRLGDRARRLRASGRLLSMEGAFEIALGESRGPLTERERAVAVFVSDGLSDREIAVRLVISERTVENHVRHIREKLALRSRAQVGRWLAEHAAAAGGK